MPEINPIASKSKKDVLVKPSPSAQILKNVELLVAMCEDQERAAAVANEPADTSAIETAVEKSVIAAVNDTIAKVVKTAVSEALSGSIEKALEDCFSQFDKRIAQLDDRNQVDSQLNKLDANAQAFNDRFDSLVEKIDSTPQRSNLGSAEIESHLKSQFDMIGSDLADVVLKFEDKFASLERTFQDQCKTVNGFYAKLSAAGETKIAPEIEITAEPTAEAKAATVADDAASHWQQQKQAMLAKYAPEHPPLDQAAETRPTDADTGNSAADKNTDSTKHIANTDHAEIEKLKIDLEAKLREAEVELSINRARRSQESAEFERNQAALDRRTADLETKLAQFDSNDDDNNDSMSRFKRHLGG